GLVVHPEEMQEGLQRLVTAMDRAADALALLGEGEPSIALVFEEVLLVQLLHHARHRRRTHLERLGDVAHARIALLFDQRVNALEVVLGGGGGRAGTSSTRPARLGSSANFLLVAHCPSIVAHLLSGAQPSAGAGASPRRPGKGRTAGREQREGLRQPPSRR